MKLSLEQRAALERFSETGYAVAYVEPDGCCDFGRDINDDDEAFGPLVYAAQDDAVDEMNRHNTNDSATCRAVRVRVVIEEIIEP